MSKNASVFSQIDPITVAVGLSLIVLAILWKWWKKPHPKFPPGPRGVPFFGVLPWIGNYPERVFKKWSLEKYGPVMSARFGIEDVVILNNFQVINQALVKKGSYFSGRPDIKLYTQVLGDKGVLFVDYGEFFRTQKKFIVNVMKRFGQGKKEMENIINTELDYFIEHFQATIGEPTQIQAESHNMIGNIICKIIFARRFESDDPSFKKVFDVLRETYSDPKDASSIAALLFFYDYVKNLPPFSTVNKRVIQSEIDMLDGIRPLIKQHKESYDSNHIRDYIDAFIYEQNLGKDPGFSNEQLEIVVRDLFAAGTETSSSTIGWMILALLLYPDHKDKIVEEIDRALGPTERPSMQKRSEMPFTCAFIQEVQRYNPPVPMSVTHITQSDVDFEGYHIPKGTKVIPNIWGTHFDPETWKDPMVFDPYRHIDDEGNFIPSTIIIPFGIGPRFCPGESMARMEIFFTVVKLLQQFEIQGTGEPLPDLLSGLTTIVHSSRKYELILKLR